MSKRHSHNELLDALRALLSDIEGMFEGAETPTRGSHPEEFFGPFSVGKLGGAALEADISVSWPNLAISMRNARNALLDSESQEDH